MDTTTTSLSSNRFSVDDQAIDAMRWLYDEHRDAWDDIVSELPEFMANGGVLLMEGSWFDTEAMGVDPEWGSWLVDAIENTGLVRWEEGEPWVCANVDGELDNGEEG